MLIKKLKTKNKTKGCFKSYSLIVSSTNYSELPVEPGGVLVFENKRIKAEVEL
jgi:hypothetical protein